MTSKRAVSGARTTARKVASAAAEPAERPAAAGSIRERNQAIILKAAEQVFAKKGFNGATTAEIARKAGVPKPNLHYYFGTKQQLYDSVIENILDLWLGAMDEIQPDANPAQAIGHYIQNKIRASRDWPDSSRLWAIEVIGGGRHVSGFMKGRLRDLVREKGKVLARWAAEGRMDPVDPAHLMFMIWASTQTYADFAAQIAAVLDKDTVDDAVFRAAEETVVRIVLKGCGIG